MKPIHLAFTTVQEPKKIAALIIFILTFIAFVWEIVSGLYFTIPVQSIKKPELVSKVQEPVHANSPLFKIAMFGDYVPVNLSEADIKQSMLDVQVLGILFAKEENQSQVILRVGGGKEETYTVGDSLAGGAIIKRISAEGILVLHNGALESLSLPKNELIFDQPAKPLIKDKD
ncbi:MAG: general secretion pathway protein GspC [Tatlockia sp.]|nr:general secretion pathway protein GspC [Tatlockia sp.]